MTGPRIFSKLSALASLALFLIISYGVSTSAKTVETVPSKIIAIGDLHGDYDAYISILTRAALIDSEDKWIGKDAVLVQTGDIADRGPDSLKIIRHLKKLRKRAQKDGGDVITLIGNHEVMNMTGDLRYVHPQEYAAFIGPQSKKFRDLTFQDNKRIIEKAYRKKNKQLTASEIKKQWYDAYPLGRLEHQLAWEPDGEIGEWVLQNPVIVKIGPYLFLHGGLSERYRHMSLKVINKRAKRALEKQGQSESLIIHRSDGPLWYRDMVPNRNAGNKTTAAQEKDFEKTLSKQDVSHIFIGHTPNLSGINAHFGGRLVQIDTGIADHYGGSESFLRIQNDVIYAHDSDKITEIQTET